MPFLALSCFILSFCLVLSCLLFFFVLFYFVLRWLCNVPAKMQRAPQEQISSKKNNKKQKQNYSWCHSRLTPNQPVLVASREPYQLAGR